MAKTFKGNPVGLILDLKSRFITIAQAHKGEVPSEVICNNANVMASFLDMKGIPTQYRYSITLHNFDFKRSDVTGELTEISIDVKSGRRKCDLKIMSDKVAEFLNTSFYKLVWLVNECKHEDFLGKLFEILVIEGMLKFDFASWNKIGMSKFLERVIEDCDKKEKTEKYLNGNSFNANLNVDRNGGNKMNKNEERVTKENKCQSQDLKALQTILDLAGKGMVKGNLKCKFELSGDFELSFDSSFGGKLKSNIDL